MINIVESAMKASPMVTPSLFVDDLSGEVAGPKKLVIKAITDFTRVVVEKLERDGLEVSRAKSVCLSSESWLCAPEQP